MEQKIVKNLDDEFKRQIKKLECVIKNLNHREKFIAMEWLKKLKNANTSIDEMKIRNMFIAYFVENCDQCGGGMFGMAPFNNIPPNASLQTLRNLIPLAEAEKEHTLSQLFDSLPDQGEFLIRQPVPREGTFFILTLHPV